MRTALYVFAVLALAAPLAAPAVTRAAPWAGGDATVTPVEQRIGELVSGLAGTPASARCASPRGWRELGAQLRFDPDGILGIVPWTPENAPEPWTALSPYVCGQVAAFVRKPRRAGQKRCRAGGRVRRCPSYASVLESLETLTHESAHLAAIGDEAAAECFGMQLLPYAAWKLGARPRFAVELGRDYRPLYRAIERDQPEYWSRECRDGGRLDLFPGERGWPLSLRALWVVAVQPAASLAAQAATTVPSTTITGRRSTVPSGR